MLTAGVTALPLCTRFPLTSAMPRRRRTVSGRLQLSIISVDHVGATKASQRGLSSCSCGRMLAYET